MKAHILVDGTIETTSDVLVVRSARRDNMRMWIDLEERTPANERLLAETFGIHPLVAEDVWTDRSIPKIDAFDDYVYVVVHGVQDDSAPTKVKLWVLDIIRGADFIITQHRNPHAAEVVRARLIESPRLLAGGTAWVAHAFVDVVVDRFFPLMGALGNELDAAEQHVVEKTGAPDDKDMLRKLFALKRSVQELTRITAHQRAILERLASPEHPWLPVDALPYFRDVRDHFVRVEERVDTYHDVVVDVIDAYLGVQSNRMNETVKRLTAISTVMLPLTFIASFYGMNFERMPEIHWRYGYAYVVVLMAVTVVSIVTFFKLKRWF